MATFDARATATILDQATLVDARRQLDAGNKVAAIKVVREATGLGLAEAKAIVEAIEAEGAGASPGTVELTEADAARLKALLLDGNQIDAIKMLREASGHRMDLKTGRMLIRAYAKRLGAAGPGAKAETHFPINAGVEPGSTIERDGRGPLSVVLKSVVAAAIALGVVVWMVGWPAKL